MVTNVTDWRWWQPQFQLDLQTCLLSAVLGENKVATTSSASTVINPGNSTSCTVDLWWVKSKAVQLQWVLQQLDATFSLFHVTSHFLLDHVYMCPSLFSLFLVIDDAFFAPFILERLAEAPCAWKIIVIIFHVIVVVIHVRLGLLIRND